jgi:hypothetical protein
MQNESSDFCGLSIRVRILVLDSSVIEILPQQTVGRELALLQTLETGRLSSVRDAIVAALVKPSRARTPPARGRHDRRRRHEEHHHGSTMFNVGRQTDAVLHVIGVRSLKWRPGRDGSLDVQTGLVPMLTSSRDRRWTNQEWKSVRRPRRPHRRRISTGRSTNSKSDRTIDAVRELRKGLQRFSSKIITAVSARERRRGRMARSDRQGEGHRCEGRAGASGILHRRDSAVAITGIFTSGGRPSRGLPRAVRPACARVLTPALTRTDS